MSPEMDNYKIPRQRQPRTRVSVEEQFARLLEVSVSSAALADGEPAIGRLLTVAGALRTAGAAGGPAPLPAASRAAMRQRLVAVATVSATGSVATFPDRAGRQRFDSVTTRMHRRLVAVAGSFAVITSMAGVGVAAAHSLPGNPFYGVKRATEAVQLWAAHGDAAKGKLHLEFARTRLAEAEKLPTDSSHLASTLAAMNAQTKQGSDELISAYRSSKSTTPVATLVTFASQQYADLTALATHLPVRLQQAEVTALTVLTDVTGTVRAVTGASCLRCLLTNPTRPGGPTPSGTDPGTPASGHPTPAPSQSAGSGGKQPSTNPTTPATSPTKTPSSILPTGILPTNLLPSLIPGLSQLLDGDAGSGTHKHKTTPKPLLSPLPVISSLLNGLGL
jgi:hypothetical protein